MPTYPTPEQVHANLMLLGGRISSAASEVLNLLSVCLPGSIAFENSQTNLQSPIEVPKFYRMAPEKLDKDDIDGIVVGWSIQYNALGPGQFESKTHLLVYSIQSPMVSRTDVIQPYDRILICAAILYFTLGGWADANGNSLWYTLIPIGITALPQAYQDYSGVGFDFEMRSAPGAQLWIPQQ